MESKIYLDLLESGWGLIANSYGGQWERASLEWQLATKQWRDQYFEILNKNKKTSFDYIINYYKGVKLC